MGGDGGSVPTRGEMVKLKKKKYSGADPNQTRSAPWLACALTMHPLTAPIVACDMGYLYNKESVIKFILDKEKQNFTDHFAFSHLTSLKHVYACNVMWEDTKQSRVGSIDEYRHIFSCPVTRYPANGRYPFVLMRKCGCVIAEKALDLIEGHCINCSKPLKEEPTSMNWIQLNPRTEEEKDQMRLAMLARRSKKKKKKKRPRGETKDDGKSSTSSSRNKFVKHKKTKRPGASINPQFKMQVATNTENPLLKKMFLTEEEQKVVPLLTSTKIRSHMGLL